MLPLLLLSLLGTAMAGVSVRMPYLNPAGVTYTSYSTAYGPLAYKALATPVAASAYAAAPLAANTYAAAAPYAAAPLAATTYAAAAPLAAAPLAATTYAAAPASVAVPVTKIRAQPAVVQNVVDVAHPKVATRRYEIRRPAIQKQFYDIEERISVRPAGSAVVELDTPISTSQRGPTQVSPAVPVAQPAIRYGGSHGIHFAGPFYPSFIPQHQVPFAPAPPVYEQPQEIEQFPQEVQQIPQQPQPVQPQPLPQPSQPFPQPAQPFPQESQPEFDSSDSVSIENPEFSRSGGQPQRLDVQAPLFRSQLPQQPQPTPLARTQIPQEPQPISLQEFERLSQSLPQGPQPQLQRSQPEPIQQVQQNEFSQQSRGQLFQLPAGFSFASEEQPELSFARSQRPLLTPRPEVSPRQGPTGATPQPAARLRTSEEVQSRGYFEDVIPSARNLSPEESNLNQARLIDLLTARGPVSELRSSGEAVRARVISATPAPPNARTSDAQVNTRRVVVNRPIQTVQEVEVVEPFTKIERVAVHQPAVVKTAHVELAHVPATVHAAVTPVPFAAHYV